MGDRSGVLPVRRVYNIFLSLKPTPLIYYRKFLREMNNGMTHEMVAEFVGISPDLATHDGVSAHVFEMSEGPKEKGEDLRTFYWDASKPLPEIKPGENVARNAARRIRDRLAESLIGE